MEGQRCTNEAASTAEQAKQGGLNLAKRVGSVPGPMPEARPRALSLHIKGAIPQ